MPKILIVGSAANEYIAPIDDPTYEVWTYGLEARRLPRVDLIFEMHKRSHWNKFGDLLASGVTPEEYRDALVALDKPVYMCEKHEDIPRSIEYPKEYAQRLFGAHFASTVAYMLAMAIMEHMHNGEGVQEIAIWGVEMLAIEEWAHQRPNMNKLIGYAMAKNISLSFPPGCMLMGLPFMYGYELPDEVEAAANAQLVEDLPQLGYILDRMAKHALDKEQARRKANGST